MAVIEFRKLKCDKCGKEEEVEDSGSYPSCWLVLDIVEWSGNTGQGRFKKEVCSDKCALKVLNDLKEIPPVPDTHIF